MISNSKITKIAHMTKDSMKTKKRKFGAFTSRNITALVQNNGGLVVKFFWTYFLIPIQFLPKEEFLLFDLSVKYFTFSIGPN